MPTDEAPLRRTITVDRSVLGIRTGPVRIEVEMVEALVAERLAEALRDLSRDFNRMPDAGLTKGDPRWDWWNETTPSRHAARAAIQAYEGNSGLPAGHGGRHEADR